MENHLKEKRVAARLTQGDVAIALTGSTNHTVVSLLEAGRCLPTADGMQVLCNLFNCKPSDLYDAETMKLYTADKRKEAESEKPDEDRVQFRVWIRNSEKRALEKALRHMGYESSDEWFRCKMREALNAYRLLNLENSQTLAETLVSTETV